MYQGYPFDRLRRRLGLDLVHADSVAMQDLSCASLAELQDQDHHDLDDVRLVETVKSAAGMRDDELTARFALELVRRKPSQLAQLDLSTLFAPLVRLSMQHGKPRKRSTGWSKLEPWALIQAGAPSTPGAPKSSHGAAGPKKHPASTASSS